jgi:serine protease Do
MSNRWTGIVAGLLVGVLLAGGLLLVRHGGLPRLDWPSAQEDRGSSDRPDSGQVQPVEGAGPAGTTSADLGGDIMVQRANAIVRATRKVAPAVVSINVIQAQSVRSRNLDLWVRMGLIPEREYYRQVSNMGSGVIISEDGYIVTNRHVIEGAVQVVVTLSNGRQYQARLVDDVARYDLAVLQIQGENLPVADLAVADDLQIGEWAIAIGSPYGYLLADTQPTVTVGVISALNRDIRGTNENDQYYLGMIQTDAAINPGNSGGPLVNSQGVVVGINTFIFSDSAGGSVGIGFAVPVSRVRTVMEEIRQFGHYREFSLGFDLQKLTPGAMQYLNLTDPVGFLVVSMRSDSPAWKAGLRPGDVLREVEGQRFDSVDILRRLVYEANVDDRLRFVAERGGERWTGEIFIEEQQ